ncbi:RNA polymerase sigma factor [Saccharothrix hoggarensis]|uniref:RNA polymerase sigma factor n=1 Tax=Saccharothrix hoggarensis TaxID=913853 RepID=A0ABW3R2X5_9PSEU
MPEPTNTELIFRARAGDASAWNEIVRRYARLVWAVPRSHRLSPDDAADVCQAAWLALAENLARIERPERLGAWLVTTARREALTVLRLRGRERVVHDLGDVPDDALSPEDTALAGDAGPRLWRAYVTLTDRCREILRLAAFAPDLTFAQVAAAVGVPVNSLGATRGRCLAVLRRRIGVEVAR